MCFSPPVMLATFLIEFGLIFYVLWRYKMNSLTRLIAAFLACLGIFQLAEFMLCGGLGLDRTEWVKLGFVSITLLPALGLHITAKLAGAKAKPLLVAAYSTAILFTGYFIAIADSVIARECAPNYAVFEVGGMLSWAYVAYYYGWLLAAMALAAYWSRKTPAKAPVLRWMVAGYAVFIVPTTIATLIDPATIHAIPSIMCGFAVLCALILVWRVLPLADQPLRGAVPKKKTRSA